MEKNSNQEVAETTNTKTKPVDKKYPYGFRRLEAARKFIWYVHMEALKNLSYLCHQRNMPGYLWDRIEANFCNSYGLSKWMDKIYVQEEIVWDDKEGGFRKDGLAPLYEDYLTLVLDEQYQENQGGIRRFCRKWERIAQELQAKAGARAKIGDEYDLAGRRRDAAE